MRQRRTGRRDREWDPYPNLIMLTLGDACPSPFPMPCRSVLGGEWPGATRQGERSWEAKRRPLTHKEARDVLSETLPLPLLIPSSSTTPPFYSLSPYTP